jgi:hypothetical protein
MDFVSWYRRCWESGCSYLFEEISYAERIHGAVEDLGKEAWLSNGLFIEAVIFLQEVGCEVLLRTLTGSWRCICASENE